MIKLTNKQLKEIAENIGNYDVLISTMKFEYFTLNERVRKYEYFDDYSEDELKDTAVMFHVLNDVYDLAVKSDGFFILVEVF